MDITGLHQIELWHKRAKIKMKRCVFMALAMFTLVNWQLPTFAATKHKSPIKVARGPVYTVNITAGAWEGVSTRVKLTLDGHTAVANLLRVNGLKSGIHTASVTLLKTDLLNTNTGAQTQTILEYTMYAYGGAIEVISMGDYTFPNPFFAPHGNYDLSMAWGKDINQIPDLPLGKTSFARYRIGDTCKIVFFVGSPYTTLQEVASLVANRGGIKDAPKASNDPSELDSATKKLIEPIEGRKAYAYLDSNKGLITIGIGHLVNDEASFEALNFVNSETGIAATPSEKTAYYQTLSGLNHSEFYGTNHPASDYLPYDKDDLIISNTDIDNLFDKDIQAKISSLRGYFPHFDSFPLPAREALVDLQYNPGNKAVTSETGWPKLKAAINQNPPDWLGAAKESHRSGIGDERNSTIYRLFATAAQSTAP